jgi:hypothetical protein
MFSCSKCFFTYSIHCLPMRPLRRLSQPILSCSLSRYHKYVDGSRAPTDAVRLPSHESRDPCIRTVIDVSASWCCVRLSSVLTIEDDWMLVVSSTKVNPSI